MIKLENQNRTGVLPEHKNLHFTGGAIRTDYRMTIPAREAFERVSEIRDGAYYYTKPPVGIVAVMAPQLSDGAPAYGLATAFRCTDEPPFPGERPNPDMWVDVDLAPCPKCGAALVWYESGYVPGYRVCAGKAHHHFIARSNNA